VAQWEPKTINKNIETMLTKLWLTKINIESVVGDNITNMFSINECMDYLATAIDAKRHIIRQNWIILINIKSSIERKSC